MSKVKNDFTTNSSSSSFVCYGINVNKLKLPDDKLLEIFNEYIDNDYIDDMDLDVTREQIAEMTEAEKVSFAKFNLLRDYFREYGGIKLETGGYESKYIGITPYALLRDYPNEKIGDIKKIAANLINGQLGTELTEKDITYYEEGWHS